MAETISSPFETTTFSAHCSRWEGPNRPSETDVFAVIASWSIVWL